LNFEDKKYKLSSIDLQNICISARTISFVTNHMHRELSHVDYFTNGLSEKFHRPLNPSFQPKNQFQFQSQSQSQPQSTHPNSHKKNYQNRPQQLQSQDDNAPQEEPNGKYRNYRSRQQMQNYRMKVNSGSGQQSVAPTG
jgi:hypothetical protein